MNVFAIRHGETPDAVAARNAISFHRLLMGLYPDQPNCGL
jgi:hypothetical protein